MSPFRTAASIAVASVVLLACGEPHRLSTRSDGEDIDPPAAASTRSVTDGPTVAPLPGAATEPGAGSPAQAVQLEQPAVWPASDVVFATPEEAAADFVSTVFGVEPTLGEFRAGDQRSGEIDVLYDGDEVSQPQFRSGLALRKLTPTEGWFVIGARNQSMSLSAPVAGSTVPPGALTVQGAARGFEGTAAVSAFPAGDASVLFGPVLVRGGAMDVPEPFSASLDLSAATPGSTAVLLVGDTPLDDDPGEFSAVPITVTDTLPASR